MARVRAGGIVIKRCGTKRSFMVATATLPQFAAQPVNTPHLSAFERSALASSLLTQEQLQKARASLLASEPREIDPDSLLSLDQRLANKLVEMGLLNLWQAQQLLAGRTKFTLGPYCIVDSIGCGGMGQVFKAEHGSWAGWSP